MLPILAGPTASGKTSAALALADALPLEVVSADAMMVYRHMDIGTAKPTRRERERVPHHLVDVLAPDERFSVADYVRLAEGAIGDVLARGKLPVVVGGTGFYLRALTCGLPTVPEADPAAQAELWARLEHEGIDALHRELQAFSPPDAARAQRNPRRVVRALEIIARTGKAPSAFPFTEPAYRYATTLLLPPLEQLTPRIAARTEAMFAAGLTDEVRALLTRYPELPTARQAIGYKEVFAYLEGQTTLQEAKEAVTLATTRYAKRQRTWFRKTEAETTYPALGDEVLAELETWLKRLYPSVGPRSGTS